MANRQRRGFLVVNVGPPGPRGKKLRTTRESEGPGTCTYCGRTREKGAVFSYTDDGKPYCNIQCMKAYATVQLGLRPPSHSQISQQNKKLRDRRMANPAPGAVSGTVIPMRRRRSG